MKAVVSSPGHKNKRQFKEALFALLASVVLLLMGTPGALATGSGSDGDSGVQVTSGSGSDEAQSGTEAEGADDGQPSGEGAG